MEPRPVPGEDFWRLEDDAAYAAAASAALRRHVDAHGNAVRIRPCCADAVLATQPAAE